LFGDRIEITKGWHDSVFGEKKFDSSSLSKFGQIGREKEFREVIQPPTKENVWCKIQEVRVGVDSEDPIRDRIVGWDNLDNCCVREVSGYNCALGRGSRMRYCYTANVGAVIKYAQVDGIFVDSSEYKSYLNDYHKYEIEGIVCDASKY